MNRPSLDGWIPSRLFRSGDRLMVDWCFLGDIRLTEPFFEESLRRAFRHPFRVLFRQQTSTGVLMERAATHPCIGPTGFIFHMSRCGSTLIARMLAASDRNVVVSEAAPVQSALYAENLAPSISGEEKIALLRAVIHALGQTRAGGERRYFVKLDCWHTLDLALVRRAFPDVPWVFVYRDPIEVLVSQAARPAAWTVPGMVPIHGVELATGEYAARRMEYAARILQGICESALRHIGEGGLMVDYADLPEAVYQRLGAHFGCTWDDDEPALMREASQFDAKSPTAVFTPDGARKRGEASREVRELAGRYLSSAFEKLSRASHEPRKSRIER